MSSKNIWIINHYAIPPDQPGGTRHFDLARQLVMKGNKVTIFAAGFNHYTHQEFVKFGKEKIVSEIIDGVQFQWFKTPPYQRNDLARVQNMLMFTYRVLRAGKKKNRPDVILGSSVHLFAVWAAYKLASHFKLPFLMEVRDIWPQTLIDMGMRSYHPFVKIMAYLERKLYREADHIITLLPNAASHISKFGVQADKISWISNGVNIAGSVPLQNSRSRKKTLLIKYAGSIGLANNMDVLLNAAAALKDEDVQIDVYGDGPLKAQLEDTRAQLHLENIRFMGAFPKQQVNRILSDADVLYVGLKDLPLYRFGISFNKLFDYMAAAKPVIFACKTFNNPVADAECGITIPPDDAKELTDAIRLFIQMPQKEREAMGMRGYEFVKANFTTAILADQLDDLLEKTLINKK